MHRVSEALSQVYQLFCEMFVYEIAESDHYPFIGLEQFERFCDKYRLLTPNNFK